MGEIVTTFPCLAWDVDPSHTDRRPTRPSFVGCGVRDRTTSSPVVKRDVGERHFPPRRGPSTSHVERVPGKVSNGRSP